MQSPVVNRHEQTFLGPDDIGARAQPYRPTFSFPGEFIDSEHERIGRLPLVDNLCIRLEHRATRAPVPGWLQRADALKLYEMARFSAGDIVEFGTFHGLSAIIISTALRTGNRSARLDTVDIDPACTAQALANLAAHGLDEFVTATTGEATAVVARFVSAARKFAFAFIDHSHAYQPVLDVCTGIHRVLHSGGFVLFHDYNDPRNRDASDGNYGVYQAVQDGLSPKRFEFYGIYGCAALYRLKT